jgi:serine/threonine protein kinase/Tol biopolymer transport system component
MLMPGMRLGGTLEIVGPLGTGGMGEVYQARDTALGRSVAVKVLPQELADDPDRMARFDHEARTASALNHPNIVTLYHVGRDGSTGYQVLELVQGSTLRELLAKGPLPLRRFLQIAEQLAAGLAAAHAAGIVHRDLKPENVMVRDDGVVKILDFGLAKLVATSKAGAHLPTGPAFTSPGAILGTVGYMSPEQARGEPIDFRSDQFALGSVMYEMATGARPFAGDSAAQTMAAIIEKEPEPIGRSRADLPRPLSWILDRCLAKSARERYASTLDLARDLRNVREHLSEITSEAAAPDIAARPRALRWSKAYLWGVLGLVLGVLLGMRIALRLAPKSSEPAKLHTITFSGQDAFPTASADGHMLAFASTREGLSRIWLKSLVDGNEVPLTAGPDTRPRISPDGSTVLFARDDGGQTSLYRVAAFGGEPRKLVPDAFDGDWSPAGDRVVFLRLGISAGTALTSICVVGIDGGGERVIDTVKNASMGCPRWSPDGSWIAVSASQFGASESAGKFIHLVRADGSGTKQLRPPVEGGDVSGVAWIGGGEEVIYSQGESVSTVSLSGAVVNESASRILRQRVDTGEARIVLWMPTLTQSIDIVGPGHIVLDAVIGRQNLQEFDVTHAPGVASAFLSRGASIDRQPTYSPDGQWVAFSSNRSGNLDIWARSLRTEELRRLTDHVADDWDPAFTRDGRQLIWTSRRGGNFEIWMANADGTGAHQVTHDGFDAENATATPDGQWLIYNSANPQKTGIWKIRTDGTQATRLVAGTCAWPEVSPDGRFAAFTVVIGASVTLVKVAQIDDGQPVPFEIQIESGDNPNGRSRWMPDGHSIAFNWQRQTKPGIYAQDFRPGSDTSTSRRALLELEPGVAPESFGISPDGTRLTLSSSFRSFSLMSVENIADLPAPRRHAH